MKKIILTLTTLSLLAVADSNWRCELEKASMFGQKITFKDNQPSYLSVKVSPTVIEISNSATYKGIFHKRHKINGVFHYFYKTKEGVQIMWVPDRKHLNINYKNLLTMDYGSCQENTK